MSRIATASVASTMTIRTAQNAARAVLGMPSQKVWTPAEVMNSIRHNDRQVSSSIWTLGKRGLLNDSRTARYAYRWMVRKQSALSGHWIQDMRNYLLSNDRAIGYLTSLANGVDAVPPVQEQFSGAIRQARPNIQTAQRMAQAAGFGWAHGVPQIPSEPVWNPALQETRPSFLF
jgi:hypothetical protein